MARTKLRHRPLAMRRGRNRIAAAALALGVAGPTQAIDVFWDTLDGRWTDPGSWAGGRVPGLFDDVFIGPQQFGVPTFARIDSSTALAFANQLFIGGNGFDPVTLVHSAGWLTTNRTVVGFSFQPGFGIGHAMYQSGDSLHRTGVLQLGMGDTTGEYSLDGGRVEIAGTLYIGDPLGPGAGRWHQSRGTVNAMSVWVGQGLGRGDLVLSGGSLTTYDLGVGQVGTGQVSQSGGVIVATNLQIAGLLGSSGRFDQSGGLTQAGSLRFNGGASAGLGVSGGVFEVAGGVDAADVLPGGPLIDVRGTGRMTVAGEMRLQGPGDQVLVAAGGTLLVRSALGGRYINDGGTLDFGSGSSITSLELASSTYTVQTVRHDLEIGTLSAGLGAGGGVGVLQLESGVLSLGAPTERAMPGGRHSLQLNGGHLQFASGPAAFLRNDELFVGAGDGSFSLQIVGAMADPGTTPLDSVAGVDVDSLLVGPRGTLRLSGGQLAVGASGTPGSAAIVQGRLEIDGGRLQLDAPLDATGHVLARGFVPVGSGRFVNQGLFEQLPGLLRFEGLAGGIENRGRWEGVVGGRLELGPGAAFTNAGTLHLPAGSALVAAGSFSNAPGGTLSGSGRLDLQGGAFVNDGRIVLQGGRLEIVQAFTNRGRLQFGDDLGELAGGAVRNEGRIEGRGAMHAELINLAGGSVEAKGGTLVVVGHVQWPNQGLLAAGAGATLAFDGGLKRNEGTIRLAGGTLDNRGTETLFQAGTLQATSGSSQILGRVVHEAGSRAVVSGAGGLSFYDAQEFQDGSELRVAAGASATFFGDVRQRNGALFTGPGAKYYEAGYAVGDSPGLAEDGGSITFGPQAFYEAEIGGLLAGSGHDHLRVAGRLVFGGTLQLVSWAGFVAEAGQSFDLFDWGEAEGRFSVIDAAGLRLAPGASLDLSRLYVDGSVAVVPEPGTWALWLAGAAVLGLRRRRLRR